MMPNITRGSDFGGLMRYLAGPGRHNEHTEPHLITGDPAIMAWHDDAELDRDAANAIGRALDEPRRLLGTTIPDGPVWHVSLAVRAEEGQLGDEKWAAISQDFVTGMGFIGGAGIDENGDPTGRADCRWVAVHHGQSTAGNDHVHIVVSLVRDDGTKADVWRDWKRAQKLAGELERKHGLEVLESRGAQRGDRGVKPAELAKAERLARPEPERVTVARAVRGAATASQDEAEFVRRVRGGGMIIRPRYAAGDQSVIVGYSVAQRPAGGERPIWFGGGTLARDLALPRLRQGWTDTPQAAQAAAAEWTAAKRGRRPVAPGREAREVDPALWEQCTAEVHELRQWLANVPATDHATWARVATETSGAFAAWSARVETTPGPLAATADALARSAQVQSHRAPKPSKTGPSARSAAMVLSSVAHGGQGTVAQAVLLRQLANTARALHDAHLAVGEAKRAAQIAEAMRHRLESVRAAMPPVPDRAPAMAGAAAAEPERVNSMGQRPLRASDLAQRPGSPVPNRLEPARRPQGAEHGLSSGVGPDRHRPDVER
ncbi:relaxase [Modestobacter muralis]|uniref:Relaxase n=1 Tax=Modestobacter muralis TaxID=1608614 RepID=A0A6P0F107_9ACTN|nr:relaxase [Modestobacter muralis]NEK96579.1 relaxase [Modestobacter muralis]NEN53498.1 relaxase [Modestobacter muralis]